MPYQDPFTSAEAAISTDHSYIHIGIGYSLVGSVSLSGSAASSISILTPANSYVHLRPSLISTTASGIEYKLAEGATVTGGSAATPYNKNRNKTTASSVTAKTGVTISVAGTTIELLTAGTGGSPAQASGGGSGSEHEIVLKPSTTYTITLSNLTSTATVAYYNIFWYEETAGA